MELWLTAYQFCLGVSDPTLRRLGVCREDGDIEDLHIGVCLAHFGVFPKDTKLNGTMERFNGRNIIQANQMVYDMTTILEKLFRIWLYK